MLDEVPACARALLAPRLDSLEARLAPGCSALTWASMNIDGYLHYARQVRRAALLSCMYFAAVHARHRQDPGGDVSRAAMGLCGLWSHRDHANEIMHKVHGRFCLPGSLYMLVEQRFRWHQASC